MNVTPVTSVQTLGADSDKTTAVALLIGLLLLAKICYEIVSRRALGRFLWAYRDKDPFGYWLNLSLDVVLAVCFLYAALKDM